MKDPARPKDMYGRKPTSSSRGKTHDRILAMQHEPGMLPGAEAILADRPAGSLAEAVMAFHAEHVQPKPVTTRRAYERSLTLFVRDLVARGPLPNTLVVDSKLDRERFANHLDWRMEQGLHDAGELQRSALHLARLGEWLVSTGRLPAESFVDGRAWMRAEAVRRIADAPPAFHVAADAAALRDVSGDADLLDPSSD